MKIEEFLYKFKLNILTDFPIFLSFRILLFSHEHPLLQHNMALTSFPLHLHLLQHHRCPSPTSPSRLPKRNRTISNPIHRHRRLPILRPSLPNLRNLQLAGPHVHQKIFSQIFNANRLYFLYHVFIGIHLPKYYSFVDFFYIIRIWSSFSLDWARSVFVN